MGKNILIGVLTVITGLSLLSVYDWSTNAAKKTEEQIKAVEEAQRQEKAIQEMYEQEVVKRQSLEEKLKLCEQSVK